MEDLTSDSLAVECTWEGGLLMAVLLVQRTDEVGEDGSVDDDVDADAVNAVEEDSSDSVHTFFLQDPRVPAGVYCLFHMNSLD